MGLLIRFFIVLTLLNYYPMIVMAKDTKHNHNSKTISEIKKAVDFTVLTPKKIPDDWTLEIKTTLGVMLHYMDSKDTKLMVAIHQRKGVPLSPYDFPHAQLVDINGNKGYFREWINGGEIDKNGDTITGGLLNWVQDDTFIEMNSSILPKERMLEIARSMK